MISFVCVNCRLLLKLNRHLRSFRSLISRQDAKNKTFLFNNDVQNGVKRDKLKRFCHKGNVLKFYLDYRSTEFSGIMLFKTNFITEDFYKTCYFDLCLHNIFLLFFSVLLFEKCRELTYHDE